MYRVIFRNEVVKEDKYSWFSLQPKYEFISKPNSSETQISEKTHSPSPTAFPYPRGNLHLPQTSALIFIFPKTSIPHLEKSIPKPDKLTSLQSVSARLLYQSQLPSVLCVFMHSIRHCAILTTGPRSKPAVTATLITKITNHTDRIFNYNYLFNLHTTIAHASKQAWRHKWERAVSNSTEKCRINCDPSGSCRDLI